MPYDEEKGYSFYMSNKVTSGGVLWSNKTFDLSTNYNNLFGRLETSYKNFSWEDTLGKHNHNHLLNTATIYVTKKGYIQIRENSSNLIKNGKDITTVASKGFVFIKPGDILSWTCSYSYDESEGYGSYLPEKSPSFVFAFPKKA